MTLGDHAACKQTAEYPGLERVECSLQDTRLSLPPRSLSLGAIRTKHTIGPGDSLLIRRMPWSRWYFGVLAAGNFGQNS